MFDSIKVLKYTKLIEYFNLVIYQYISYRTALSIKVYKTSEWNDRQNQLLQLYLIFLIFLLIQQSKNLI